MGICTNFVLTCGDNRYGDIRLVIWVRCSEYEIQMLLLVSTFYLFVFLAETVRRLLKILIDNWEKMNSELLR